MKNFTLTILSALCFISCTENTEPVIFITDKIDAVPDTTAIYISAPNIIKTIDLLVYSNETIRQLVCHHISNCGRMSFKDTLALSNGPYLLVVIANCPGVLNDAALARYDAIEELQVPLSSEDPAFPTMSGIAAFNIGDDVKLVIDPLLSSLEISGMESDLNLYDLEFCLTNLSSDCEVLRWSGFWSRELLCQYSFDESIFEKLSHPEMVYARLNGYQDWRYDVYPKITLYCFPNDSDSNDIGSPPITLEVRAKYKDNQCIFFKKEILSIKRGTRTALWLELNEENAIR